MTRRGSKHNISRAEWLENAHQYVKRGEALPQSRLTEVIVRKIRANKDGLTARQWAERIGVHHRTIEAVQAYRTWALVR